MAGGAAGAGGGGGGGGGTATTAAAAAAAAMSKEAAKAAISWAPPVKSIVGGLSRPSPPPCEGKEADGWPVSVFPKPSCATAYAAPRWLTRSCIQARSRPRLLRRSGLGSSEATGADNREVWSSSSGVSSVWMSGFKAPSVRLPPRSLPTTSGAGTPPLLIVKLLGLVDLRLARGLQVRSIEASVGGEEGWVTEEVMLETPVSRRMSLGRVSSLDSRAKER